MSQEYVSLVPATESPFCKILIQFPYRHIDDVHSSKSKAGQAVFTTLTRGIYNINIVRQPKKVSWQRIGSN